MKMPHVLESATSLLIYGNPLYTESEVFRPPIYAYGKCKKSAQTLIVYCGQNEFLHVYLK